MLVVTLGGSPSQRSRSGVLLDHAKRWLNQQGVEVVSYQVRDFPAEDLLHARFDCPKIIDLLQQIEYADGLVMMFGNSRLQEAEKYYAEAAKCTSADAMERLDIEAAKAEMDE